jgi:hypothetical protein
MQVTEPKKIAENPDFIFIDFECYVDGEGTHKPNLLVAQYADGTEFRFPPDKVSMTPDYDVVKEFCLWLFTEQHENFTVVAHNMKAYDGLFILSYCIENNLKITTMKNGTKLISMRYDSLKMNFRDTLNFLPVALSNLPRAVGLSAEIAAKGDFAHRANKPGNWDKVIPFPDISEFMIEKWDLKKRNAFALWHASEKSNKNNLLDFRREIVSYCSNDVTVLRLCALKFRKDFIALSKIDPLAHITISSACRQYYTTI